jgi:hypothetical protein
MHKCQKVELRCNVRISCSSSSAGDEPLMLTSSVLEEGGIHHSPLYYSHGAKYKVPPGRHK